MEPAGPVDPTQSDQGQPKDVILIVVQGVVGQINAQLVKAEVAPHDGPPLLDEVAMLQSTATILNHAEAEGTRNAGLFAALLVFLGALCSLLIPNPEKTRGPGDDGIPDTHGEWDVAPPANTELHEQTP